VEGTRKTPDGQMPGSVKRLGVSQVGNTGHCRKASSTYKGMCNSVVHCYAGGNRNYFQ